MPNAYLLAASETPPQLRNRGDRVSTLVSGIARLEAGGSRAMKRRCSLPSCWHSAEPSASVLLMHEVAMLANTQMGIDCPPGEWPPLGTLACLAAPDGRLQTPSRLVIVEDFRSAIQRDLADDLGHGFEILGGIQR